MAKILSIDTSCDETSVAVTEDLKVLSNVLWSQASLHNKWGGVYPSLAKRAHEEHIDWVVEKALSTAKIAIEKIDAIAVTVGPGLAVALEVGIRKAKELSKKNNKPFIPINHIEGHLLSVLAKPISFKPPDNHQNLFPAMALVASGKHTDLILIKNVGKYEIIGHTVDDALGEALDKAARMLSLGYPGGAILEKFAKEGNLNAYSLTIPMLGQEHRFEFSYSGIKTAIWKLVEKEKPLNKQKIVDLAASFQNIAFKHIERLTAKVLEKYKVKSFFFGGGVSANTELRKRLRKMCKEKGIKLLVPYSKKLCTDNAAMIGIAAHFKLKEKEYFKPVEIDHVERIPRAKVDEKLSF